jgi:hypothetical protein
VPGIEPGTFAYLARNSYLDHRGGIYKIYAHEFHTSLESWEIRGKNKSKHQKPQEGKYLLFRRSIQYECNMTLWLLICAVNVVV